MGNRESVARKRISDPLGVVKEGRCQCRQHALLCVTRRLRDLITVDQLQDLLHPQIEFGQIARWRIHAGHKLTTSWVLRARYTAGQAEAAV